MARGRAQNNQNVFSLEQLQLLHTNADATQGSPLAKRVKKSCVSTIRTPTESLIIPLTVQIVTVLMAFVRQTTAGGYRTQVKRTAKEMESVMPVIATVTMMESVMPVIA